MPVQIYDKTSDDFQTIGECSQEKWDLSTQIDDLKKWLNSNHQNIPKGKYVADIGFTTRTSATGGGGVISIEMICLLNNLGMEIYLSEYGCNSIDVKD